MKEKRQSHFADLSLLRIHPGAIEDVHEEEEEKKEEELAETLSDQTNRLWNLLRNRRGKDTLEKRVQAVQELLQCYPQVMHMTSEDNHQTALHLAAIHNQPEQMSILLQCGANPELLDSTDFTPLMYTINKQSMQCFELLLENKVNVNTCGKNGRSALHIAVEQHSDDERMVECLLKLGADVDQKDKTYQRTPLHTAAKIGSAGVLQKLLDANPSSINKVDSFNLTPLHLAAENGHRDCCSALLTAGANCSAVNRESETPLMKAVRNCYEKTCEALLQNHEETIDIPNHLHQTPLIVAAVSRKNSSKDVLRLLLDYGPNLEATASNGDSPLHYAARGGYAGKCELLIKKGADCNMKNDRKLTPLHCAVKKKFPNCVAALLNLPVFDLELDSTGSLYGSMHDSFGFKDLSNGEYSECAVDVNSKDDLGKAPIHYALEKGSLECCFLLLRRRANVCLKDSENNTPLHLAAIQGLAECCSKILSKGAEVDAKNKESKTALHLAAAVKSRACCQVLLKRGAKLNVFDRNKMSPLHYASGVGSVECCELLLKRVEKNFESCPTLTTPLHLAAKGGHLHCCRELIRNKHMRKHLLKKDEKGRMPHNIAFEEEKDDTFCYLLQNAVDYLSDETRDVKRNLKRRSNCANDFMLHPSLSDLLQQCIRENRRMAVQTMINCAQWKDALSSEKERSFGINFSLLVKHFPDVAKTVLDRCIEEHKEDKRKVYSFLFLEDTYYCTTVPTGEFLDGGLVQWMSSEVNKIGDRIQDFMNRTAKNISAATCFFLEKVIYPSDFTRQELLIADHYTENKETPPWSHFSADGSLKPEAVKRINSEVTWKENHPLCCMVQYKRLDLLGHEVCQRLLKYKWERYVGKLFYSLFFISAVYVGILSLYVTFAYDWVYVHRVHNLTRESMCEQHCIDEGVDQQCTDQGCCSLPQIIQDGLTWLSAGRVLALVWLFISVAIELFKIHYLCGKFSRLKRLFCILVNYFSSFVLLIDWTECASVTGIREEWQWICGVISVMLAWFNLIMLLGRMPRFGVYLFMLNDFMMTMLKLATFLLVQVVAFSVAFQMLLRDRFVFSNYFRTTMKILTMTLGDLSYDDLFSNEQSPLHYPFLSHVLLVSFLGLISVIMLNFLSNFSQDELDKAKKQTRLITLSRHVEMTLEMESMFPILRRHYARGWVVDLLEEQNNGFEILQSPVGSLESPEEQEAEEKLETSCKCVSKDLVATWMEDLSLQISDLENKVNRLTNSARSSLKRK